MFLNDDDIAVLTGRKVKAKQIEALRLMGVAFFVNAIGKPIVARSTIEGRPGSAATQPKPAWCPNVLTKKGAGHGKKTNSQSQSAKGYAGTA